MILIGFMRNRNKIVKALFCTVAFFQFSIGFAYSGRINRNEVFPSDINKWPILFLEVEKTSLQDRGAMGAMGPDVSMRDKNPEKVNKLIEHFIARHKDFQHKLVTEEELSKYPAKEYKYVVRFRLQAFKHVPSGSKSSTVGWYRPFKSVFYFEDRLEKKSYQSFYDTRTMKESDSSAKALPVYPPDDKDFFKDLNYYIDQLNKYGTQETIAREAERAENFKDEFVKTRPINVIWISLIGVATLVTIIAIN